MAKKHYQQDAYPSRPYDIARLVSDLIRWKPKRKGIIMARYATRYRLITGRDIKTDQAILET